MYSDLVAAQVARVSGRRCQQHVAALSQIHRIMGTPGYTQAIAYVRQELTALGVTDLQVERFAMDGAHAYGDWIAPVAWTPRSATLWVESPERLLLCDFAETPICLHVGSQSTLPDGLCGELIDIGAGLHDEDYGQRDVRGAIALTSGNVREVYAEAMRRGVAGLISDNMPWQAPGIGRSPLDQPDLISYNKLAVRREEIGSGFFSFGLSARQGRYLRQLLGQGPVRLRARVDATAHAGEMEVLTATLPGAEPGAPELVLISHLCHPQPGANDNATGPALLLELARALLTTSRRGKASSFRHQIRLLFVPEVYGTIAWLLESETARSTPHLVLNLDMVGGDRVQTRGHLWLDQTPWSVPSYANDLVAEVLATVEAQAADGWRYGVREHMGGSDHVLFLAPEVAAPALMLGHEPDRFYHSNQDTVDKTEPREFEKVSQVVLATLQAVDRWTAVDVRRLAYLVYTQAAQRIVAYAGAVMQRGIAGETVGDYRTSLAVLLAKEQAAMRGISGQAEHGVKETAHTEVVRLLAQLATLQAEQLALIETTLGPSVSQAEGTLPRHNEIPRKHFRGPISSHLMGLTRLHDALGPEAGFYQKRSQEDRTFVRWMFEAVNLMDGQRTLGEIQAVLQAEFGTDAASTDDLEHLLDDLVRADMASVEKISVA